MSNWITKQGAYPWSEPLARDLHKRLTNTFWDPQEVLLLVRSADAPNWLNIDWKGSPANVWVRVLDRARVEGSLQILLKSIVDKERIAGPTRDFINDLLAGHQPVADPGPGGGPDGTDFDSVVSKEEANLFGDDLSESVGEIPDLLAAIERVMKFRGAVCRLLVTAHDGTLWNGTGTLLTGNRVLTNHHVLFPRKQKCTAASIEFHLEKDAAGQSIASTVVQGDVGLIRSDDADDWAVIPVAPPAGVVPVDLAASVAAPVASERAFILQHPEGGPKRLAFVRNRISSVSDRRVFYLTDTRGGSSGSPVFDARGKMVALHRAGGEPQKLTGMEPVKKNEGVRMDIIAPTV